MRKLLLVASLAVIGAALVVVPMPLAMITPATPLSVPSSLQVDDGQEIDGRMLLTAVRLEEPSIAQTVGALVADDRDVRALPRLTPPGVDEEDFADFQRQLFRESVRVAAAVGMDAAGLDVTVSGGGARVVDVIEGSPADDELEQGDVVTHVNGERVSFAAALAAVTSRAEDGDTVELTVRRGDETFTTEVGIEPIDELRGRPGLGVAVRTLSPTIELPRELEVDFGDVGGPSGGLMLALTVYDQVSDTDLARGRVIAGTGTITIDGTVGEVGEVDLKVIAAERAGADLFLVPASEADQARSAADSMEVVPVRTLDDALEALTR